jgi:ABC-type Mn2+/Zn2+ transport system ATPase subunit
MIKFQDVDIYLQKNPLFKGVNLSISAGEMIRLIGSNGSGKTTLLDVIVGLRDYQTGNLIKNFQKSDYGYLPQVSHQFPKLYLQLKDVCSKSYSFYPEDLFNKSWHTSSGGERKRALIARALSQAKNLLILDEPFNHLDQASAQKVSECLVDLNQSGMTIIYTGHDHKLTGAQDIEVLKWRC